MYNFHIIHHILMKKLKVINYYLCGLLTVAVLTGCQEKKQSTVIIAPKSEAPKPTGPIEMSDMNSSNSVDWIGKTYSVEVSRKADHELSLVEVEPGKKAYDNRITLKIIRPDGTEFFNRTFTKAAFEHCLDENTKKSGVLLGIVLDRAEGDDLIFAASVGSPDALSDEYIPMVLTVGRMGNVNIKRDTTMDADSGREQTITEEDEGV